jgi:hypothetical protein
LLKNAGIRLVEASPIKSVKKQANMKSILFTHWMLLLMLSSHAQDGLVAYWSFDQVVNDTIYDESGYGNHGTNYWGNIVEGVQGNALSFNGVRDYARIPADGEDPPEILSELEYGSISVWFKARDIPTDYGIAPIFYYGAERKCDFKDAANKGLIIELGHSPIHMGSRYAYFTIWKNGCTFPSFCFDSNVAIPQNNWQHLVVVVGEDFNTGYLNGKEMVDRIYNFGNDRDSQFFADALAHEKLWLAKGHWDRTTQYFDGSIDELRIYSRALSESEVEKLYKAGNQAVTTSTDDPLKEEMVRVFPNPASDKVHYDATVNGKKLEYIEITDITGKKVGEHTHPAQKGSLNLTGLKEGIYFLGFQGESINYQKKVLIQRR